MPAVRAAAGLAPTARSRNPMVLLLSSHQTIAAAATASRIPRSIRSPLNRCGNRAVPWMGLLACGLVGATMDLRASRYSRPKVAT